MRWGQPFVHLTNGSNSLHFFYDAQNKPAVVAYHGTPYSYVKNLQGDIVAILDSNKNVVVSYVYDAWGSPISCSGTMASTLGKLNPFRYRGYIYDEETELFYLRSRYYVPAFCRFVSPDIIITADPFGVGANLYSYCKNSPINYYDETGREYKVIGLGIQVDGSISFLTASADAGIELICYWGTEEAQTLDKLVFAVYGYGGGGVTISDYSEQIDFITQIVYESMDQLAMMGADEVQALLKGKLIDTSISGSIMVITGNEGFKDAYNYEGHFETATVGAGHVKLFKSWGHTDESGCEVYGGGGSTSWSLPYYSRSSSEYVLICSNGYSRKEAEAIN